MDRKRLANASGGQKRQARMQRTRLETRGAPKEQARERAAGNVRNTMKNGGTRVVSKREEAFATDKVKPQRATKRRK
jgi:hypothetical protein